MNNLYLVLLILFSSFFTTSIEATSHYLKKPSDVYEQALILKQMVRAIRENKGISQPWPTIKTQQNKFPRHVLRKAIYILHKLNKFRKILNLGPISIPSFPSRKITPNEVFDMVERLKFELLVLEPNLSFKLQKIDIKGLSSITPSDVFRLLWEVSNALDPILGIRGINPSDVYQEAEYIVGTIKFLRKSQNMPNIAEPEKKEAKLTPFQSIQASNNLLKKIHQVEKNLGMIPVEVFPPPRKVTTPGDVMNSLQIISAELQRIKFNLGLENNESRPLSVKGKIPNDVIQKIEWAIALLPELSTDSFIYRFDQKSLIKDTNNIFANVNRIEQKLDKFVYSLGIRQKPKFPRRSEKNQPKHVYAKILECIEKLNQYRKRNSDLSEIAIPKLPLRPITSNEIFELTDRLDDELKTIFSVVNPSLLSDDKKEYMELPKMKILKNVFHVVSNISMKLDLLLGKKYSHADLLLKQDKLK